MNESLVSEVDWGEHDSSEFLFMVNMDCDARSKEFFIQGLWGGLQHRTPPFLSLGSKLILWLLDRVEMIFSTPHQLTQT